MSHSSGPWTRDGVEIFNADGKHVVWEVAHGSEDDARLIAAAPDLLLLLKELARASNSLGGYWAAVYQSRIESAIAKAEGPS